jgi:hypothetical protein
MESLMHEDLNIIAPLLNTDANKRIAVIEITTSSNPTDLSALLPKLQAGHFLDFVAVGCDVYYAMSDGTSGSVSETATGNDNTCCDVLFDGERAPIRIVGDHKYLIAKGSAAGLLRIRYSSLSQGQGAKDL